MAIGKKTGGRDFKLGESGNPNGRPPLEEDLRNLRARNKNQVEQKLSELLFLPVAALRARVKEQNITALDAMLCNVISTAIKTGDCRRVEFLLGRLIGKPQPDELEATPYFPDPESAVFPPGYLNKIIVMLNSLYEDEVSGAPDLP